MIAAQKIDSYTNSNLSLFLTIPFVLMTIYLEVFLARATGYPFRSFFDFLVLSLAFILFARTLASQKIKITHFIFILSVIVFTFISMLGSLEPGIARSVISAIIFSKFVIVFFLARSIDLHALKNGMKVLGFVHVAGSTASLFFPEFFQSLLPQTSYDIDTSRLMGFSLNANRSATVSSALLLYYATFERRLAPSLLFLTLLILSESRSIITMTAIVYTYIVLSERISVPKKTLLVAGSLSVFLLSLIFIVSLEETIFKIQNTVFGDLRYIRAAMFLGGVELAGEFFPVGVGGGLFGSSLSRGSEAYAIVGIAGWDTVIDMTGVFDSGFGAILGEYGYLGLLAYILIVGFTFRYAHAKATPIKQIMLLTAMVLFLSFFRTVASDFFYSFYILFIFLLVTMRNREIGYY